MQKPAEDYRLITVETYLEGSDIRVRPVPRSWASIKLNVSCSKSMRQEYPVGTRFRLYVLPTEMNGSPYLYARNNADFEALPADSRMSATLAKKLPGKRNGSFLSSAELTKVTAEHIWIALESMAEAGFLNIFGHSTDFDLVTESGQRLPPKAVFGVAATKALGFQVLPRHFSAGRNTPCFNILEQSGFIIVPKDQPNPELDINLSDDDRRWIEGNKQLRVHIQRERAAGLAAAKKENFIRLHGLLYCELCDVDPCDKYGLEHGPACIEVHHKFIEVGQMNELHHTKLSDLQCLCANCHRVEHHRLKHRASTKKFL